jgi:hypothetical protein
MDSCGEGDITVEERAAEGRGATKALTGAIARRLRSTLVTNFILLTIFAN